VPQWCLVRATKLVWLASMMQSHQGGLVTLRWQHNRTQFFQTNMNKNKNNKFSPSNSIPNASEPFPVVHDPLRHSCSFWQAPLVLSLSKIIGDQYPTYILDAIQALMLIFLSIYKFGMSWELIETIYSKSIRTHKY
jgi:hypothetical protein